MATRTLEALVKLRLAAVAVSDNLMQDEVFEGENRAYLCGQSAALMAVISRLCESYKNMKALRDAGARARGEGHEEEHKYLA